MLKSALDSFDQSIIDILLIDSRTSLRAIGAEIGLTAPAVRDRILRMEDTGIIEGFSVRLNARALGFMLEAILNVEPLPGRLKEVEQILRDTPEVLECSVVTGNDCFVARFVLKDVGDLDRILEPLHNVARTKTSIVHRKPIPSRRPPF
ncbi:hypothetical protein ASG29_14205 [Sphingomonas sp. Leaf412]|uniref:Lrp/AsnC family transcriptional regulator n=1 Tax=Sphingomonas sp. Leaf412 TaxID=1736370 RepID=UPI0006F5FE9D|nr:Lrp/AsnC family transcriptional regulator [Sphingomonas sp. Leaf412]KQT32839.1 hypothetical protein ASG29_14205 [Sphingomonas sp. Leaf412]